MTCRSLLLALLVLAPTVRAAPPRNPATTSEACTGRTGQTGTFRVTLESGGYPRSYWLHVPSQYDPTKPTPMVFDFHGNPGNGWTQALYSGLGRKSDEAGFIAVAPDGYDLSWNAGKCCGRAFMLQIDDVGFVRDMIKTISAEYCVDAARVFAEGFSNGAYFANRLGCEASDVIAAIAPASGIVAVKDCAPPRPVPVVQTQGTDDPIVPYADGKASNDFWAACNGCGAYDVVYQKGSATCIAYTGCLDGATVEWCEVEGMGHAWPSSDRHAGDLDAGDTFWDFFTRHPMPASSTLKPMIRKFPVTTTR